ncbi:ABC transporter permease [Spongisporangium articulatum]|uniref:ABC transporter permease n=1 Tax=Spongisporangium articulatum TaxID=3362603 RepID=A0ABW8ARI4_9ACTN
MSALDLSPAGAAAPARARVLAQARFDLLAMLRNGEQLLLTLILPLLVLVGLARSSFVEVTTAATGSAARIDIVTPGVLALALISTAFTGQAIGTGFDRRAGFLRLLGTTPLGRSGLLAGRVLATVAVQLIQIVVLGAAALALGWSPAASGVLPALGVSVLGSAAFVALGLLLAGTMRAEAVLAVANLVWVLLLAGGGVVLSSDRLGGFGEGVRWLPSAALGDGLRAALEYGAWPGRELLLLAAWAVIIGAAATRWFRWDS